MSETPVETKTWPWIWFELKSLLISSEELHTFCWSKIIPSPPKCLRGDFNGKVQPNSKPLISARLLKPVLSPSLISSHLHDLHLSLLHNFFFDSEPDSVFYYCPTLPCSCLSVAGELYFLATGAPSAAVRAGVIYKIIDPSRYPAVTALHFGHKWTSTLQTVILNKEKIAQVS